MRHRNGLLQDRNIFVMDGQVMMVVCYHKSQSQWDKPKVVPRFLPPRLGQVMVLYLAYLQPFREYLTVQVLGGSFSDYVWADEQGPWGTDRLTRALRRETGKRLGVPLHTLDYWHAAVGEVDEAEVDEDGEDVMELQNARTTVIRVGNYSVLINIVKHLSVRLIKAFRPLSAMWHRFLGLDRKQAAPQWTWMGNINLMRRAKKRGRSGINSDDDDRNKDNQGREAALLHRDKKEKAVRKELALHAVIDGQTPLVVVLPTGGGKSLLFSVPACMDDAGVTVVVVPYRALIEDLVDRMQKCGIDCMEWKHGESSPAAVVVVSADAAGDTTSNGNFLG
ncbi:uncharacterized protein M421DRAFT_10224, partial [Didymella exigua CBS 183.55]